MTKQEAKILLRRHAFMDEDINHPKMEKGFLGMLRPFSGELIEENFHEVVEAIKVLADELSGGKIDREIISAIWTLCHFGRFWAVDQNGLLRKNNLISDSQVKKIDGWIDAISYAVMMILGGADIKTALEMYNSLDA